MLISAIIFMAFGYVLAQWLVKLHTAKKLRQQRREDNIDYLIANHRAAILTIENKSSIDIKKSDLVYHYAELTRLQMLKLQK